MKALSSTLGRFVVRLSAGILALGYLLAPVALIFAATPTPKPTCQIVVKPTSINIGGSVTVTWTSANATAGAITNIGNVGPSGSYNTLPSSAAVTTYFGAFTGPGGTSNCQASVAVNSSAGGGSTASDGSATIDPTLTNTPQALGVPATLPSSQGSSGLVPCGYGSYSSSNTTDSATGCQACNLAQLIQNIMTFAIGIAIPIAAALFAYAGFLYFTSASNPANVGKAKGIFKDAFVGFLIAITAWLVINTLLHVIFSQGTFSSGNWFTIECTSGQRQVNGKITDVLSKLPIVAGNTGALSNDSGVNTSGTQSGGGTGSGSATSGYDTATNALVEQCATGNSQGSCDALDSIANNGNKLNDKVDEALSTNCDNGIQSSCDALLAITGNPDQTGGARGASGSSILAAALAYKGTDTSDGPDGGNKACAWSVNNILKNDGVAPIDGDSVLGMETELKNGRGTYVNTADAQPGDIIVWKEGSVSHVGICQTDGCSSTLSNSSSQATFGAVSGSTLMGVAGRVYRINQ